MYRFTCVHFLFGFGLFFELKCLKENTYFCSVEINIYLGNVTIFLK